VPGGRLTEYASRSSHPLAALDRRFANAL
jgi:hypothetical protein